MRFCAFSVLCHLNSRTLISMENESDQLHCMQTHAESQKLTAWITQSVNVPAYMVLMKVSASLMPVISDMGDMSNLAATRGISACTINHIQLKGTLQTHMPDCYQVCKLMFCLKLLKEIMKRNWRSDTFFIIFYVWGFQFVYMMHVICKCIKHNLFDRLFFSSNKCCMNSC